MRDKRGTGWIIAGVILLLGAFSLSGYNLYTQYLAGKSSDIILTELENEPPAPVSELPPPEEAAVTPPIYIQNPEMEMPVKTVGEHDYIGILTIPSLQLSLPIMSEWSNEKLNLAPCRYSGSIYQDNLVICAHNFDRHFGQIKKLEYGDSVEFMDSDGNVFRYGVVGQETLEATAVEEMTQSEWDLTLFTCTIGGAARVTVRCERAE